VSSRFAITLSLLSWLVDDARFRCGLLHQNKVRGAFCDYGRFGIRGGFGVIFFIAMPPKALTGAGFAIRISQNLVFKELRYKILVTNDLDRHDSISLDRHCLDHDRANSMACARSDVTMGLWKSLKRGSHPRPSAALRAGSLQGTRKNEPPSSRLCPNLRIQFSAN
jgi:hypothetical protein